MSGYKVGINYFSGWWRKAPNKYTPRGSDWRTMPEFSGRCALLGMYNDALTVDAEIIAASKYGVDFFQFLWYGRYADCPERDMGLDSGLHHFCSSQEAQRMEFCVEYCNHPPFGITDDKLWDTCCEEWISYMLHPSYLRVGGKAVFKIHGFDLFVAQCSDDPAVLARRLDRLRNKASEVGAGELCIGCGVCSPEPPSPDREPYYRHFDYFNTYMMLPEAPYVAQPYPYSDLLGYAEKYWSGLGRRSPLPYIPFLPAGWDPRPWGDARPPYKAPTREEWNVALTGVKRALDTEPMLALGGEKLFTIYAWNEFGEGGIVAPTAGEGYMKLEEIKRVFGDGR